MRSERASARRITAVMPYFGYARQDRRTSPAFRFRRKSFRTSWWLRERIDFWRWICTRRRSGIFQHSCDHCSRRRCWWSTSRNGLPKLTIVSPDAGGVENAARAFAKRLNAELAMVNKRRLEANVAQVMNVIGDVEGQTCLVVDDMIDTAGTLMKTVRR